MGQITRTGEVTVGGVRLIKTRDLTTLWSLFWAAVRASRVE